MTTGRINQVASINGSARNARIVPPKGCKTYKSARRGSARNAGIVPPKGCKTYKSAGHNLEQPLVRDAWDNPSVISSTASKISVFRAYRKRRHT